MKSNDIPLARRDIIAERLKIGQSVVSAELAKEFDLSEDAIRRDLRALAADGLCRRVYGGALPILPSSPPMSARIKEGSERKAVLGRSGAEEIQPGELLFLDSGSTNLALTPFLPEDFDLTVATNSLAIASALQSREDIRLIILGGCINPQIGGSVDSNTLISLMKLNIDRAYLGVCGMSLKNGACALHPDDANFKRQIMQQSKMNILLATNEKFSTQAHFQFSSLHQFHKIFVEPDLDESIITSLEGISVNRA
ncbi:Glycerol-3-phosphate regulon repressor [Thalassocella blandensis]|nr:Glycerol-3-phosphate regulon repressor [Thalassocella blandensis]